MLKKKGHFYLFHPEYPTDMCFIKLRGSLLLIGETLYCTECFEVENDCIEVMPLILYHDDKEKVATVDNVLKSIKRKKTWRLVKDERKYKERVSYPVDTDEGGEKSLLFTASRALSVWLDNLTKELFLGAMLNELTNLNLMFESEN